MTEGPAAGLADRLFGLVEREVARRGGGDAELHVRAAGVRRYEARGGGVDAILFGDSLSLGVRVFRDGRMGFSYCFRDDEDELRRTVEAALFSAGASDPDPAYGLPDDGGAVAELRLHDPSAGAIPDGEKAAFACALEAAVLAADPRIKRVRTAGLVETVEETAVRNSRGRAESRRESAYYAFVDAVAEDGGDGQTGYGFGFARRFADLSVDAIAAEGARRALRMLSAGPLATGRYPAVIENGAAAELLEALTPAFLASNVAKGRSMLAGKAGERVASPAIRLVDDPFDPRGAGACAFDAEGVPSRRNVLVEGGILAGYLADTFWGRKLGTGSTASCRRPGPKAPPTVGASNVGIVPGQRTVDALLRETGTGILVTDFLGIHTADPVSGNFSVGAAGIRFENGEETAPVRGFAVSGNVLSLLAQVAETGSDFRWFGNVGAPSLAVPDIAVGGE